MGKRRISVWVLWALASAAGTGVGAYLATRYFPGAGFAQHPTGQYAPLLFAFAFWVALPMALTQCLVLVSLLDRFSPTRIVLALFWLPVTVAGVMAMILPLWRYDAFMFQIMPFAVAFVLLPGVVLMGLVQNLILYALFGIRIFWTALTVVGVVIGAILGLLFAMPLPTGPLEITWAIFTGAGIGWTQGYVLAGALVNPSDGEESNEIAGISD